MNYNKELFLKTCKELNIEISDNQAELLDRFAYMLTEKNKVMNLTAIKDEDGIAVKHFADSLSILKANEFKSGTKVLDLGTGAGFPGIPLLIARQNINISFLDSTLKKLNFVESVVQSLGFNCTIINSRAEEAGRSEALRESFDVVTSRAVAALNTLCEYALPLVKLGGVFIAMKGSAAKSELDDADQAITVLGGKVKNVIDFSLPDGDRSLIIIEKIKETPDKYPRNGGQISKKPL